MMRTFAVFVGLILALPLAINAQGANPCNVPGTREATEKDDVVKSYPFMLGRCYNPNEVGIGAAAEAARQYLLTKDDCSHPARQRIYGENPRTNCILKLDANFAIALAKVFKENPGGHFTNAKIHSAYSSEKGEQKVSGRTTGPHRRGCAVDLVGGTWSKQNCGAACQYVMRHKPMRLNLPYHPKLKGEANHMELISGCIGPGKAPSKTAPSSPKADTVSAAKKLHDISRSLSVLTPPQPQPAVRPIQPPKLLQLPVLKWEGVISEKYFTPVGQAPASQRSAIDALIQLAGFFPGTVAPPLTPKPVVIFNPYITGGLSMPAGNTVPALTSAASGIKIGLGGSFTLQTPPLVPQDDSLTARLQPILLPVSSLLKPFRGLFPE